MKVGFIALGRMGLALASHLQRSGVNRGVHGLPCLPADPPVSLGAVIKTVNISMD